MEQSHREANHHMNNFINNVINDLKNLSNLLRSLNRHSADVNNSIINKLLLGSDRDSLSILKDILTHLLHIVDLKGINVYILSILTKVISFIKIIEEEQLKSEEKLFEGISYNQEMTDILYHIIDIIFLFKNKHKQADMMLRIIQITFSLIDIQILQYVNYHLLIRIYSICFECCLSSTIIQNISTSALFALTEIVFASIKTEDSTIILSQFLQYLLANKKFSWIKDQQLKTMVWDLIIVGIRSYPTCEIEYLSNSKVICSLINEMYRVSVKRIFSREESKPSKHSSKGKKTEVDKATPQKKEVYLDFIRYLKTFVFFSIHLAIRPSLYSIEIVPFKENIQLFKIIYELDRDPKLYLLLEGISLLLIEGSHLLVEDERPILLLDIFGKVVEELCLSNIQLEISSEAKQLYLQKMCGDLTKINDSDYPKLIRNTVIKLRKKFEGKIDKKVRTGELMTERTDLSEKSESEVSQSNASSPRKRWQRLISNVIRIIRYLTSMNMKDLPNEQIVRKLIIELQYWYLICPSVRTRNLILQELLSTSTHIDSKLQAIKVSQCIQIGSNIIYGYYESLDCIGLTIILRMMALVKTSWEEGKGFEELDEVCTMSEKLYIQQNLVHSQKSFSKTVQSFVQCVNGLIGDCLQSSSEDRFKKLGRNPLQKIVKMTEYIFGKLQIILNQNAEFIHNQWNFLTGFWLSLCCNSNQEIKHKTMNHVASVIHIMLKKTEIQQEIILSTYLQLSKLHSLEIAKLIIEHLKQLLLSLQREEAIVQIFRIIRIILETKGSIEISNEVYQLEEMLIKEVLFKVKCTDNIVFVIDSLSALNEAKNEEYKTVNLLWSISDHLKVLAQNSQLKEADLVWRRLFEKLYWLGLHSIHGETKQSCIHSFTQILAESTSILGVQSSSKIIHEIFLELFYVLMNLNQKSPQVTGSGLAEMVKVGLKNLMKIIKKCRSQSIEGTPLFLNQIIDRFLNNFPHINQKEVTVEYLYEICMLLEFYKSQTLKEGSLPLKEDSLTLKEGSLPLKEDSLTLKEGSLPLKEDSLTLKEGSLPLKEGSLTLKEEGERVEVKKEKILDFISMIQDTHERFDHSTVYWRKKYEPAFKELKRSFSE